jgi:hypothetical protein
MDSFEWESPTQQFKSGAQRDNREGKGRFDLITPEPMALFAGLLERGGKHYGDRNWEKGMPISRMLDSLKRHLNQFELDDPNDHEDHLINALFNLWGIITYRSRIRKGDLPASLDDANYFKLPQEDHAE